MNLQSLQAQLPVGPAMKALSGSSRVKRCIIPVSVKMMKVSEGCLFAVVNHLFSAVDFVGRSRTVWTHIQGEQLREHPDIPNRHLSMDSLVNKTCA